MRARVSSIRTVLLLEDKVSGLQRRITAGTIVLAVGTQAVRDARTPLDGQWVFSSDDVMELGELPRTLAVIGAGVIGCEYASMFAALGVRVTLIDMRPRLLEFVDAEIVETLVYHLRERRVTLRLGEEVSSIEVFTRTASSGCAPASPAENKSLPTRPCRAWAVTARPAN